MKASFALAVSFALLLTTTMTAQETSLGTYLHGNWTIKGTVDGEEITGTMFVSPASDGASQLYRWTVRAQDEIRHGSAIAGIDPATGNVVEHGFGKDFYWKNSYDNTLGDSLGQSSGTRVGKVKGEDYEAKILVERTSENEFQYTVEKDGVVDVDFTFTRMPRESNGQEAFKAYTDLVVGGTWTTTIDGVTYEDSYERIHDSEFVMMRSKGAGEIPSSTSILGVDPANGKFTWWGFADDGTVSIGTSRQTKEGVWVGSSKGNGPKGKFTSRGRLTRVNENTVKYEILEEEQAPDAPSFPKMSVWTRK